MVDAGVSDGNRARRRMRATLLRKIAEGTMDLRRSRNAVRFHHSQMAHLQRNRPAEFHQPVFASISFWITRPAISLR